MKLLKGSKQHGDAYYGAFAQHDVTGGGHRWEPQHASPGIDSTEVNRDRNRSQAGVVLDTPTNRPVTRGFITTQVLGGRKIVKQVV